VSQATRHCRSSAGPASTSLFFFLALARGCEYAWWRPMGGAPHLRALVHTFAALSRTQVEDLIPLHRSGQDPFRVEAEEHLAQALLPRRDQPVRLDLKLSKNKVYASRSRDLQGRTVFLPGGGYRLSTPPTKRDRRPRPVSLSCPTGSPPTWRRPSQPPECSTSNRSDGRDRHPWWQ